MKIKIRRVCLYVILTICAAALLCGCDLPTYNLSGGDTPLQTFEEFMEAVINGENDKIGDMIYNYSWDSEHMPDFQGMGENDARIIECVEMSRSYEIVSGSGYMIDSHNAQIAVNYTTFDIGRFEDMLSGTVLETIQRMQYEGTVFEDSSDTDQVIEAEKRKLLENPEDFITTKSYTVEMISYKGRWRVILSDEFYSALSGYAV